jgi:hypothetical protein
MDEANMSMSERMIEALRDLGYKEDTKVSKVYRTFYMDLFGKRIFIGKRGACLTGQHVSQSMASEITRNGLLAHWERMQSEKAAGVRK